MHICNINPLNAELNPICHLLALFGAHPFLHISRIRVNTTANTSHSGLPHAYTAVCQCSYPASVDIQPNNAPYIIGLACHC